MAYLYSRSCIDYYRHKAETNADKVHDVVSMLNKQRSVNQKVVVIGSVKGCTGTARSRVGTQAFSEGGYVYNRNGTE